jgi:iron-sulfur cluster insertion protein
MSILLTPSAIAHISTQEGLLRVRVKSGGCSGLRYVFTFEKEVLSDDYRFDQEGVSVIVDPLSFAFIEGATIDYHQEMLSSHFTLTNPKATNSCGCGDSFSVF